MGKHQPAPPPMQQNPSALSIPPPPAATLDVPRKPQSDSDIEKVLKEIDARQAKSAKDADEMTPGGMAFGMMRNVPRKDWNTPLTELGHWPRGSTVAEIKANPELKNFTPAQAMLKLFEMDDAQKGSFKRTK